MFSQNRLTMPNPEQNKRIREILALMGASIAIGIFLNNLLFFLFETGSWTTGYWQGVLQTLFYCSFLRAIQLNAPKT